MLKVGPMGHLWASSEMPRSTLLRKTVIVIDTQADQVTGLNKWGGAHQTFLNTQFT